MKYFAFGALFTALIKAELSRLFTVKLEINTLFTPKAIHSLAILMVFNVASEKIYLVLSTGRAIIVVLIYKCVLLSPM